MASQAAKGEDKSPTFVYTGRLMTLERQGRYDEFFATLTEMKEANVRPNTMTYGLMQQVYLAINHLDQVHQCIHECRHQSLFVKEHLYQNGLRAAAAQRDIGLADEYLQAIADLPSGRLPSVASLNAYLHVCAAVGDVLKAFHTYGLFLRRNLPLTRTTCRPLVRACIAAGDWLRLERLLSKLSYNHLGAKLMDSVARFGIASESERVLAFVVHELAQHPEHTPTLTVARSIATILGKRGDLTALEALREAYPSFNLEWSSPEQLALVDAYTVIGDVERMMTLCNELLLGGTKLYLALKRRVIITLCRVPTNLDTAYLTLANIHNEGKPVALESLNLIVHGCGKVGELDRAFATYSEITHTFGLTPDVHSMTALMFGCAQLRQTKSAFKVFEQMQQDGVEPVALTYTALIQACIRDNDVDRAVAILDRVTQQGIVPPGVHSLLIRKAIRCDRKDLAEQVVQSAKTHSVDIAAGLACFHSPPIQYSSASLRRLTAELAPHRRRGNAKDADTDKDSADDGAESEEVDMPDESEDEG